MSNGLKAVVGVAVCAAAAVWLVIGAFEAGHGHCVPTRQIVQPSSQPGPPVADWRPPQHRWETPR